MEIIPIAKFMKNNIKIQSIIVLDKNEDNIYFINNKFLANDLSYIRINELFYNSL